MLFLHGYVKPTDFADMLDVQPRRHFGAGTAAQDFVAPLGNRAASERWFGDERAPAVNMTDAGCIAGGCG